MLAQSMRLGVQRLLHRQGGAQQLTTRELYELSGYVQGAAAEVMSEAKRFGATRFVGTSGTIRTLGEGAHLLAGGAPFRSLNAQSVKTPRLAASSSSGCAKSDPAKARQNARHRRRARRHDLPRRRAALRAARHGEGRRAGAVRHLAARRRDLGLYRAPRHRPGAAQSDLRSTPPQRRRADAQIRS